MIYTLQLLIRRFVLCLGNDERRLLTRRLKQIRRFNDSLKDFLPNMLCILYKSVLRFFSYSDHTIKKRPYERISYCGSFQFHWFGSINRFLGSLCRKFELVYLLNNKFKSSILFIYLTFYYFHKVM